MLREGRPKLNSGNLAGAQATGADVYRLRGTANNCLYAANIGLPSSVGLAVGMGNVMTEGHTLTAKFTLCQEKYTSYLDFSG